MCLHVEVRGQLKLSSLFLSTSFFSVFISMYFVFIYPHQICAHLEVWTLVHMLEGQAFLSLIHLLRPPPYLLRQVRLVVRTSPRNPPVFTPSTQFRNNRCAWSWLTFTWVLGHEESAYICLPSILLKEPSPRFKTVMFLKFIFCHMIVSIECF